MRVVVAWLRLELRRRWRSLVVLALLIAISSAVVMTSLAAARRGASALTRLADRTLPTTVLVLANQPGFDWTKVAALPEVESLARFVVDYNLVVEGVSGDGLGFPFIGADLGRTIERPVVFSGRYFDPSKADEAVVTRQFVKTYHKGVGDTVVLDLPSAKQLAESFTGSTSPNLSGPHITVHIVGVVVSPWMSDSPGGRGNLQISSGLVAKYPLETIGKPGPDNTQFINSLIRLKGGEAAIPGFRTDLARVTGRSDIDVTSMPAQQRDIQHDVAFVSRCLLAFGLAAFVAALFLVGQAIVRYAAASTVELQTLRALGMTPNQATRTAAAGPAIVGVLGAALGVLVAWFASSHFPYGTARYFEPTPGRAWDWTVFGIGLPLVVVLVVTGAGVAARLALGAARRGAVSRRSSVASAVGRSGAPVPVLVGVRLALESGRGRTSVPVRPALIGAVIGVLGIVAAFTFSHGVTDAADNPARFGQTFQLASFAGINDQDFGPAAKVAAALRQSTLTTGVDDSRTAVATAQGGDVSVSLWEYESGSKPMAVSVLSGHLPTAADEVMLAPKTLTAMHTHVGDRVVLTGNRSPRTLLVTGTGLVPQGPHNGYADGGWVSTAGYDSVFKGFKFHLILISLRHGASPAATIAPLVSEVVKAVPSAAGLELDQGEIPGEVAEIRQVKTLPILLGGFLGLLAIGAVGHALATAVRRRSHDLAVLRALGMTQWQCRWVVVTQATVLALVGLVFGVPLGFALGRTVWRVVADYTPIQYVAPVAAVATVLIVPAALVIANLLGAWPGRHAARMRISHVLRAE